VDVCDVQIDVADVVEVKLGNELTITDAGVKDDEHPVNDDVPTTL
jgi:hypothetical protein